jgi:hypothetical protein
MSSRLAKLPAHTRPLVPLASGPGIPLDTVVTWKWTPRPGYRSTFGPETVNVLRRMVARHFPHPHRFVCVTDDPRGLDSEVWVVEDRRDFADLPSPHGGKNPSCYRRLRAFAPDAGDTFGGRFVSLDLDCVIVGDLTPLWLRPEPFVIWGDTAPRTRYNGSMYLLTAGARPQVWTDFDPTRSPLQAMTAGNFGSDQAWISYCLGPGETRWTAADGVYSYRNQIQPHHNVLPANARVVIFHGALDPWSREVRRIPWVQEAYQ